MIGAGAIGLPLFTIVKIKKSILMLSIKEKNLYNNQNFLVVPKLIKKINTIELVNKLKSSYYDHVIDTRVEIQNYLTQY